LGFHLIGVGVVYYIQLGDWTLGCSFQAPVTPACVAGRRRRRRRRRQRLQRRQLQQMSRLPSQIELDFGKCLIVFWLNRQYRLLLGLSFVQCCFVATLY